MGKGQDAKKNVKKEPAKTQKEKRAEKRAKKSKQGLRFLKKQEQSSSSRLDEGDNQLNYPCKFMQIKLLESEAINITG